MKVVTWNVNSIRVRQAQVIDWLKQHQPDVLALQEIKVTDDKFPTQAFADAGYHVVASGQKTYNGVSFLTKQKTSDILCDIPNLDDPQRRILIATVGGYRIINLYVPNGSTVDSEKYHYKLDWLSKVTEYIKQEMKSYSKLIVLGDFNIAPEDCDVHDPAAWAGSVLVSEPERAYYRQFIDMGLVDAFRQFEQEQVFSWWDYRQAAFRRNRGLRIDLILVSDAVSKQCQQCYVDKAPRGLEQPSDHAPVVIELE